MRHKDEYYRSLPTFPRMVQRLGWQNAKENAEEDGTHLNTTGNGRHVRLTMMLWDLIGDYRCRTHSEHEVHP